MKTNRSSSSSPQSRVKKPRLAPSQPNENVEPSPNNHPDFAKFELQERKMPKKTKSVVLTQFFSNKRLNASNSDDDFAKVSTPMAPKTRMGVRKPRKRQTDIRKVIRRVQKEELEAPPSPKIEAAPPNLDETSTGRIKKTLEGFGFHCKSKFTDQDIQKLFGPSRSRKARPKPTLLTKRDAQRQETLVAERVRELLAREYQENMAVPIHEPVPWDSLSFYLEQFVSPERRIYLLNSRKDAELEEFFVPGLFPVSTVPADHLLRRWEDIPGRDRTPSPSRAKFAFDTPLRVVDWGVSKPETPSEEPVLEETPLEEPLSEAQSSSAGMQSKLDELHSLTMDLSSQDLFGDDVEAVSVKRSSFASLAELQRSQAASGSDVDIESEHESPITVESGSPEAGQKTGELLEVENERFLASEVAKESLQSSRREESVVFVDLDEEDGAFGPGEVPFDGLERKILDFKPFQEPSTSSEVEKNGLLKEFEPEKELQDDVVASEDLQEPSTSSFEPPRAEESPIPEDIEMTEEPQEPLEDLNESILAYDTSQESPEPISPQLSVPETVSTQSQAISISSTSQEAPELEEQPEPDLEAEIFGSQIEESIYSKMKYLEELINKPGSPESRHSDSEKTIVYETEDIIKDLVEKTLIEEELADIEKDEEVPEGVMEDSFDEFDLMVYGEKPKKVSEGPSTSKEESVIELGSSSDSEKDDFGAEKVDFGTEKVDFGGEKVDFGTEKNDFEIEEDYFGAETDYFGVEGGSIVEKTHQSPSKSPFKATNPPQSPVNPPARPSRSPQKASSSPEDNVRVIQGKKFIIKTRDVTPPPAYETMEDLQLEREMKKFGLKYIKQRRDRIRVLQHIYNQTHPIIQVSSDNNVSLLLPREAPSPVPEAAPPAMDETDYLEKKYGLKPSKPKPAPQKKSPKKVSQKKTQETTLTFFSPDQSDPRFFEKGLPSNLETNETLLFLPTKPRGKLQWCPLPLHIAFCNLLRVNEPFLGQLLRYEPFNIEPLYKYFAGIGARFDLADLKAYFDCKCITFRSEN